MRFGLQASMRTYGCDFFLNKTLSHKKVYSGIDIFKLIASVLILLLHCVETKDYFPCGVKFVFTGFAVPFFFIASGFFFYKGLSHANDKNAYFWKYEKNIAKLYLVWALIIYLPFEIVSYIKLNPGAGPIKIVLLLIRRFFVIGAGPYWYLLALMLSAFCIYLIHRIKKDGLLYTLIVIGLVLGILYSCFRGSLGDVFPFNWFYKITYFVFSWELNFIMYGIPFMGIGFIIAKKDLTISKRTSVIIFVASTLFRLFEFNLSNIFAGDFWKENNLSFAFIVQAFAFFMLAKELQIGISKDTSLLLRQLSSFIYFLHVIILYEILNPLLTRFTDWPVYSGWFIPIKMLMVLVPCCVLFTIIKKIDNKYLNILING